MYTIVLAAALSAGTTTPAWGCHGGCFGCGGGCHGCWGGCHGCWGGCRGWGGCCGCCGGGCFGCYGGGCFGGACYGGAYPAGTVMPSASPAETPPTTNGTERVKPKKETYLPTKGQVIVRLPADAKLFVDDQPIHLTSTTRTVVTPDLQAGQDYYYDVKAEVVRDGNVVADRKRVVLRAGQVSRVDFSGLGPVEEPVVKKAEAKSARITVRLPESGRLFVDGVARPMTTPSRTFDTPKLEPDQSYYYTFKAEVVRNGQTRSEDRRVIVQAGKEVVVDFSDLTALTTAQR